MLRMRVSSPTAGFELSPNFNRSYLVLELPGAGADGGEVLAGLGAHRVEQLQEHSLRFAVPDLEKGRCWFCQIKM